MREAVAALLSRQELLGAALASSSSSLSTSTSVRGALLEANSGWLHAVVSAWRAGRVSNFDYLLYVNLAAGRSFNDLGQWPVFPWVLSNYTSASLDLEDPANYR